VRVDPPRSWLVAAAVSVVIGLALLPARSTALHFVGYLVASTVTIALVSTFWAKDNAARTSPVYSSQPGLRYVAPVVMIAGILVAVPHLWSFARAVAL